MYSNKEYSVIKCFVAKMNIDPQAIFTFEGADITSSQLLDLASVCVEFTETGGFKADDVPSIKCGLLFKDDDTNGESLKL